MAPMDGTNVPCWVAQNGPVSETNVNTELTPLLGDQTLGNLGTKPGLIPEQLDGENM